MLDLEIQDIIEAYGGNKQKIAQAAFIGALGPNGPVKALAAGFGIDRIRAAAPREQMPQQTVAQQVFPFLQNATPPQGGMPPGAPPAPAGLGATPQAMAMAPSAPPMGGGAPAVGMADGGMVGPYGGGLSDLPVPDTMFDEPSTGGYADGGLVAFARGNEVVDDTAGLPETFYGYNWRDPMANAEARDTLFGKMQTAYQDAAEQDYLRRQSAEYQKTQERKDRGKVMLAAASELLKGQSPYALVNFGAAGSSALSTATDLEKERKAEERDIQRGLLDIEQGRNTAAAARAAQILQMQELGVRGLESALGRKEAQKDRDLRQWETMYRERAETGRAAMRANYGDGNADPKLNFTDDTFTEKSNKRNKPDTVIPRVRVQERGKDKYAYLYPELSAYGHGESRINPAHGANAYSVRNAVEFARKNKYGIGVSQTGRLQFIDGNGRAHTISDTRMQQFGNAR